MYVYVSLFPLVKPSVARSSKKSCWKLKHWLGLNVKTRKHRIACGDIVVEEVEERNNAGSAKHKETWTSLRVRTLMTCNVCLQKTAVYWAVYEKSSGKDVALRGCRVKKNHPLVWHVKSKKISTSLRVGRREWWWKSGELKRTTRVMLVCSSLCNLYVACSMHVSSQVKKTYVKHCVSSPQVRQHPSQP